MLSSCWDEAILNLGNLIEAKRKFQKGLMQQLLIGARRLERPPSKSKSNGTPAGWKSHPIGALGATYSGLAGKTKTDFGSGMPYIPYLNIFQNSRIDPSQLSYVKISADETQHSVRRGDIFFTTSSETAEEVGMSSVLLDDIGPAYLNSFCFGFRLNSFEQILPEYARHLFRGPAFRRAIFRLAQGATRYNLSKTKLMELPVLLPPIAEQKRIIPALDIAEADVVNLRTLRARLQEQGCALIQNLLAGRVRVKV